MEGITYAPIYERDRKRMEYLNDKIWKDDTTCVNIFENEQSTFLLGFTWQKKFRKICDLRGLSAAGWDEDTFTITLDDEHYNNHIKDHKSDLDFLNKPIQHFEEMHTIFGSTMATEQVCKGPGVPLGTQEDKSEMFGTMRSERMEVQSDRNANEDNNAATSSSYQGHQS
ncbi:unnamed protein product [Miscanthus lutarioriparius]|uniref:Myb/SANT-like domain-containing protein n=1 Tax=Miscanthus lutarioriparius TaxID=422564 RepID=A0A811QXS2_9POAL|nr:unnamed protein product [Miscanthus lutarioriparius]